MKDQTTATDRKSDKFPSADNPSAAIDLNSSITIWSLIIIAAISVLLIDALPAIVIGMLIDLQFSEAQAGKVSSVQLAGIGTGSLVNLWLVKVASWRRIAYFGIGCLLIADLASIVCSSFWPFIVVRFFAGTATGVTVCICTYVMGKTLQPDRNFGLFFATQVLSGILANLLLPGFVATMGIDVVFISFIVLEVVAMALLIRNIPNLSSHSQTESGESVSNSRIAWVFCILQLITITCFLPLLSILLTYIAPIGMESGLSEQQVGRGISIGLLAGMTGSFVAAKLNTRIGRLLPILTAMFLLFAAIVVLYSGFTYSIYVIALVMYLFSWYMIYPYLLGMLASIDKDGRPMILVNAIGGIGSATGPLTIAVLLNGSFFPVYIAGVCYLLLSLIGVFIVILGSRKFLEGTAL